MDNPFVSLKHIPKVDTTGDQLVQKLADEERKKKRDTLYAKYTPMVDNVLDQMIAAFRPGLWEKGSDRNHAFCCHCRWYAGPEETGRAHYDDHAIRRRIEIELDIDDQRDPTGFKVLYKDNHSKCVHTGLGEDELVRGIKAVFT